MNPAIQRFMQRCREKKVNWGVISDLYGVYLSNERHVWYEKHPDTVASKEEALVIAGFNDKLNSYDKIFFCIRPESFHPFYKRVLKQTLLADRVQTFQDVDCIE